MDLKDFDYNLPDDLVAIYPKKERSSSRLLVKNNEKLIDTNFLDLTYYLNSNDLLIFNDTKVLPANLKGIIRDRCDKKEINVTLLKKIKGNEWKVLCKPSKKVKSNDYIYFSEKFYAKVILKTEKEIIFSFNFHNNKLVEMFLKFGKMPLPPYILKKRKNLKEDERLYQSIFAKKIGAVAASTASLHFDEKVLKNLKKKNINFTTITLHVGGGTFLPIKSENIDHHKMHSEWGYISKKTLNLISLTKKKGGRIIPVGTTSLRVLEAAFSRKNFNIPFKGETDIFIKPGYKFLISDGLITNFHLPKSTLFILISAFIGIDETRKLYSHAIKKKYKFFSYGDCCLLFRKNDKICR